MASTVLEGVAKVYPRGVFAVQALDLAVEDGEFLVLVGPSGCGKTTTLRLIAGLEAVSSGEIRIGGRVVNRLAPRERDVALVCQSGALFPHLSVARNIAFGLELRSGGGGLGWVWYRLTGSARAAADAARRQGIRQQVRRAAELLGIEHLLDRLPRQLSGGERQRVALGRALVRQPAVFLLDEPLSSLDAGLRLQLRRELQGLHQRLPTTTVYVTHDQAEAMALGGRMAVMEGGRLQQVGAPRAVYDRPRNRFVAGFVGSPPMNLLSGRLREESGRLAFSSGRFAFRLPPWAESLCRKADAIPAEVELGVRPADLGLVTDGSPEAWARGRVVRVEWLGDRTLVTVDCSDDRPDGPTERHLISQVDSRSAVAAGDVVGLAINGERVHLFDGRSGENLTAAASGEKPGGSRVSPQRGTN